MINLFQPKKTVVKLFLCLQPFPVGKVFSEQKIIDKIKSSFLSVKDRLERISMKRPYKEGLPFCQKEVGTVQKKKVFGEIQTLSQLRIDVTHF